VENEVDRFDTAGWKPYSHALACLDCLLGREIRLQVGSKEMTGRSRGIDPHGALLLETTGGEVQSLAAGEVHVLHRTEESKGPKS
jgi:biotin-(acetyl-CoA carboxylase) ligase